MKQLNSFQELGMEEPVLDWANDWLQECKSLYINGEWVKGNGGQMASINPATGKELGEFHGASEQDVDRAVQAAKNAFYLSDWKTNREMRKRVLDRIADLIRKHRAELATLESLDNGMLYKESYGFNVGEAIKIFEYYAGWTDKYYSELNPSDDGVLSMTAREPVGVCGQIVPWNVPLLMAAWKIAPALSMGNTVVLKPSSSTSFSVIRLFEIIHEENIVPPGVINLVLGGGEVGSFISRHHDVNKVSFTGSTVVGKKLLRDSADSNLKTLTLELGGKSANIIFDDVEDLDFCLERSFYDLFSLKGEKCAAPSRLFVHESLYEEVIEKLKELAESYKMGDPFDLNTDQGPQAQKAHLQKILNYIEIGKSEGARLVCGGIQDVSGENKNGYFVKPTIFADVHNHMRIAQEEIFGPVLCVIPFRDEDEVIAQANDSIYGLAAGLWTRSVKRALKVMKKLEAGMVFVNNFGLHHLSSPFGGIKQSGWGREFGIHSLEAYTRLKTIFIDHRSRDKR